MTLSPDVSVITISYDQEQFASAIRVYFDERETAIADFNWICTGVIILPGVKITGNHVIAGSGAVVTKDIRESFVVLAGNPARIVKRLI